MTIETSHGVMFQQRIILRLIEQLIDQLTAPRRNRRAILEQFRGLEKVVKRQRDLPKRLDPDRIPRRIWDGRVLTDDILAWCLDVHQYYDDLYSSNLPR